MTLADPKQRFSNRVADYRRYRPGYPPAVLDLLRIECGLRADHIIADMGSGTGLLSQLFLKNGHRVFGVEPNRQMREAGEEFLHRFEEFTSVPGSAEATTLGDASIDFVTAAQAFHWFERQAARREFRRILKPGGDRKSTRLNSSHMSISYAVFCLKKKKKKFLSFIFLKKKKKKIEN